MKNKEKNINLVNYIIMGVLLILSIISIIIGLNNKKEINNINHYLKGNQIENTMSEETIESKNPYIGTWKASSSNTNIYILKINNDNTVEEIRYWLTVGTNPSALSVDDIEKSEDYTMSGRLRGIINGNTIIYNERYNDTTKEWERINEQSAHISLTGNITLKISTLKLEFIKQ